MKHMATATSLVLGHLLRAEDNSDSYVASKLEQVG